MYRWNCFEEDNNVKEYLTYKEFAEKIGVSKQTVYRWVKAGTIRAIRFSGRTVLIPTAEAERILQVNKK
jgi:excisionase family DNA binding protein